MIAVYIGAGLIGLLHVYILCLEMFLWTKPRGLKAFGLTQEFAIASRSLAGNQGLYNGFLAAGIFWGLLYPDQTVSKHILIFFLLCVLVAGLYGSLTAKRSILFVQSVPAFVVLVVIWFVM
ncbi:DUF1304 domain-containing protein [Paenibacillus aceris]|uniref:Membrane protein n=1 Tax=Paenibacillus aceris TaxID=869555 RepID=A0ABS4HRF0_9BACL|nr:DUF1304 domain-containing protein [Paenibacillus aceris]MBP1961192.1 putative membrane protein [Paenibacillus aceris]NHW38016.1 DUF1304 domain-containing protein [Paenibacillus aceris]